MSKDEQNPEKTGDTQEKQPEVATEQTASEGGVAGKKSGGKKSGGLARAVFILFLLCAAFSGGGYAAYYYLDQQFSQIARQQNEQLGELSSTIDSLQNSDQGLLNNQQNLQRAITSIASETEAQLLTLSDRIAESEAQGNGDWSLAEAEYLLRIANQRLVTSKDQLAAIDMMLAADNIMRELAYPELAPVRRQLAEDLTRVKMAEQLDVEGIFYELEALAQQVANLKPSAPQSLQATKVESEPAVNLWRRILNGIRQSLAQYVRVDTNAEPQHLLTDEQQVAKTLTVQLQIRQAQLALLSEQQDVYSGALLFAADSIENFYADTPAARASQARLVELADTQLQVGSLDISESIRAMSAVINQLSRVGVE